MKPHLPRAARALLLLTLAAAALTGYAQKGKPAYALFDVNGKPTSWKALLKRAAGADVVLFGEYHNNPICHWLTYELTRDLYNSGRSVKMGAEMFEADQQWAVDQYFIGKLTTKQFEDTLTLWSNYQTDYKPWFEFAREHNVQFVATNVPRRFARAVARGGVQQLDTVRNKEWMAPLPLHVDYELPNYKAMREMVHNGAGAENFIAAQALKDATMAHFIAYHRRPGSTFIHLNGTYHSNNYEGIGYYLKRKDPALRVLTIATVEQDDLRRLDAEYKAQQPADVILVVPATMTKTH